MRAPRELAPFREPQRRPAVGLRAERDARRPELAGDDEHVAGPRARPARHALAAAEGGDGEKHGFRCGRVAADDGHAGLGDPLVEGDHVRELGRRGHRERHEQRLRLGARRGEVAQVHRGGAKAELAPVEPVEPEVHVLDERVLRDDEPVAQERRVVLDVLDQPAALELREEAELTELREPRQRPSSARDRRPRG